MTELAFTVYGKPAPKGSVQAFIPKRKDGSLVTRADGSPMVVKNDSSGDRGRQWASDVAGTCWEAMNAAGIYLLRDVPIRLEVDFYVPRGKGHYGTGRNAGVLKPNAPAYPAKRPDVDKWLRAILDALTGACYHDDGQVVEVRARKLWGDPARAEISVLVLREPLRAVGEGDSVPQAAMF